MTSDLPQGPFASVERELTRIDLPVVGQIPAELNGRYLRNGPDLPGARIQLRGRIPLGYHANWIAYP